MKGLLVLMATSITGWIGWWIGAFVGTMTALILGVLFSAAGLYYARWFIREYMD